MKRLLLIVLVCFCFVLAIQAQNGVSQHHTSGPANVAVKDPNWVGNNKTPENSEVKYHTNWSRDPFDHQVFIENKGQFNADVTTSGKILYQAELGNVKAYFTTSGVVYRYDEYPKKNKKESEEEKEENDNATPEIHYTSYLWAGANPSVTVEAKEEQSYYDVYPTGKSSSVNVNIFKRIVYHNIYPGIDIEYSFNVGKAGIKYSVIVHPGADVSLVKLIYSGSEKIKLNSKGDAIVQSDIGEITDHAPVSYYKNGGQHVSSKYKIINGNEETFLVNTIANSNDDLVIDPWSWDPNFPAANDQAYDVDYDNLGNVYAYGSNNPFELTKFTAAGVQQWTFKATTINLNTYGDFAVDKVTGTSYVVEGANNVTGANALKVNTLGALTGTFPGAASMKEMWRTEYNSCTRQLVIGGGGLNTPYSQACLLDTNMSGLTPVNPLGAVDGGHDVCLLTMDPTGSTAWMAIAQTAGGPTFNNVLMSLPVPSLTPTSYIVSDGFTFQEANGASYVGSGTNSANGFNGMAAGPTFLYTYDGATLNKVNKATGATIATKAVTATPFSWGGLDADACDNVYAGENSAVKVFTSALALTTTIPLANTVYDVVLGANYSKLYAGGQSFVSSTDIVNTSATITNSITPASCAGCNGSATPTLKICGAAPVTTPTYSWNTAPVQTTQTATALCKGTYVVTISLAGCGAQQFTDTVVITQGAAGSLTLGKTQTNVTCYNAANGVATVTASGGSGAGTYTYAWAPSGGTSSNTTPLGPGTYTVTVDDAACNTDTAIFVITEPTQLRDSITATNNIKCFGSANGSLSVGVKGGTLPYAYSWAATGGTSSNTTPLGPGAYTVTVTDHNGCPVTANGTITQPSQLRDSIVSSVPPTCTTNNGTITDGVKDGSPGYTYKWSPSGQTNATASGLASGTYTCVITDNNGCKDSASITITPPGGPRDSIVSTSSISCFGGANGSIVLGVNRGTLPYSFLWTNATSATTQNIGGLSAGTYSVTVTDKNGCTATAFATIKQPTQIRDSIVDSANVLCFGGNSGTATVGAKNGSPGYSYKWNTAPNQTNATATGLTAGSYICTVKDNNGCTSIVNVTIAQPKQLTLVAASFNVTCNGACNGSLAVIPKGGTTPYSYVWNTTPVSTSPSPSGLCPGTYSVVVTDNNGCTVDSTGLIITQPTAISIAKNIIISSHCGQADGSISITASGGTPLYKYLWSDGSTNQNLTKAVPGTYCVTVTDANLCTDSVCATIGDVASPVVIITAFTNVTCNGGNDGSATATATGGATPYTYSWNTAPTAQTNSVATGLAAGSYTVTVTDSGGCISTAVATITQPALVVTTTSTPATICIGDSATLNATSVGGTGPYSYTWNTGATTSSITVKPIVTTTYTVTTTLDANNCSGAPVQVVVTVNPPLSIKVTAKPDTICAGNNATLTATGSGGDGNYTYTWNPGPITGSPITVTPATSITYTVTMTDGCGTPAVIDSISVVIDPSPTVQFTADTLQGCSPLCVVFTDQSSIPGGAITSVEWSFGDGSTSNQDTGKHCYLNAGVYSVQVMVTTNIGCADSLLKPNLITVYSHPVASFTTSPESVTTLDPTIYFTNTSSDAYGIKSYLWHFNDFPFNLSDTAKNPSYTYHDSGKYCPSLIVTNIHGCTDTATNCIEIEPYFTIFIPNAFSPNADGVNDIFTAKGDFICGFQMYIFDRWGMLLYYTEDINQGWDGTVNGGTNEAQEDTYVYLIKAIDCPEHKTHSYLGKVSIVK